MTSVAVPWRFRVEKPATLPALAWVARIHDRLVEVRCGQSVRVTDEGFFEGTWAGPPNLPAAARSATVFGSGIVVDGRDLIIVPPAHIFEPVYLAREGDGTLIASNSFVATLAATGRELSTSTPYPLLFGRINRGLDYAVIDIPTTTDPITVRYFENIRVELDGSISTRPKAREPEFADFAAYRDMLVDRVRTCFANASGYSPAVALSSGYDSTATAVVGIAAGLQRALTFRTAWPWDGYQGTTDSGEAAAAALGMSIEYFERLAYQQLDDAPEAEFLASGMSGEDVVLRSMEPALGRILLMTGFWGGAAWRGNPRPNMSRQDLSGASLAEMRLRMDFIHMPLAAIGGIHQQALMRLRNSPEMAAFSVGGRYDEPVARRFAEEAGVKRGTFALEKRAASQLIHRFGLDAFSPSGRASVERFAGRETLSKMPRRQRIRRRDRIYIKVAEKLRLDHLAAGIVDRRWSGVHIEPVLGSLLLRWAVAQIRPRYADVAAWPSASDEGAEGVDLGPEGSVEALVR